MREALLVVALLAGCGGSDDPGVFIAGPAGAGGGTVTSSSSSSASGGGGAGGQAPQTCTTAKDCGAAPNVECGYWACAENACVLVPADAGKLTEGNVSGDCRDLVCDGEGGAVYLEADDPEDDGNPCTIEACDGFLRAPSTNEAPDTICPTGVCDGNGACVECLHGYQCGSGVCADFVCQ